MTPSDLPSDTEPKDNDENPKPDAPPADPTQPASDSAPTEAGDATPNTTGAESANGTATNAAAGEPGEPTTAPSDTAAASSEPTTGTSETSPASPPDVDVSGTAQADTDIHTEEPQVSLAIIPPGMDPLDDGQPSGYVLQLQGSYADKVYGVLHRLPSPPIPRPHDAIVLAADFAFKAAMLDGTAKEIVPGDKLTAYLLPLPGTEAAAPAPAPAPAAEEKPAGDPNIKCDECKMYGNRHKLNCSRA